MLALNIGKDDPIRFEDEDGRLMGTIEIAEKSSLQFCRLAFDFPPEIKIIRKKAKKKFKSEDYPLRRPK